MLNFRTNVVKPGFGAVNPVITPNLVDAGNNSGTIAELVLAAMGSGADPHPDYVENLDPAFPRVPSRRTAM